MAHTDLLTRECIQLDLQAATREDVFAALADALALQDASLRARREEVLAALRERERLGSTASQKVAIPHVKLPGLARVSLVLAISKRGVDFRAPDGELVHVFFSLVRPVESADRHLALLRWIAEIAQHRDFVPFACQARTPQEILDLLAELSPA